MSCVSFGNLGKYWSLQRRRAMDFTLFTHHQCFSYSHVSSLSLRWWWSHKKGFTTIKGNFTLTHLPFFFCFLISILPLNFARNSLSTPFHYFESMKVWTSLHQSSQAWKLVRNSIIFSIWITLLVEGFEWMKVTISGEIGDCCNNNMMRFASWEKKDADEHEDGNGSFSIWEKGNEWRRRREKQFPPIVTFNNLSSLTPLLPLKQAIFI